MYRLQYIFKNALVDGESKTIEEWVSCLTAETRTRLYDDVSDEFISQYFSTKKTNSLKEAIDLIVGYGIIQNEIKAYWIYVSANIQSYLKTVVDSSIHPQYILNQDLLAAFVKKELGECKLLAYFFGCGLSSEDFITNYMEGRFADIEAYGRVIKSTRLLEAQLIENITTASFPGVKIIYTTRPKSPEEEIVHDS